MNNIFQYLTDINAFLIDIQLLKEINDTTRIRLLDGPLFFGILSINQYFINKNVIIFNSKILTINYLHIHYSIIEIEKVQIRL